MAKKDQRQYAAATPEEQRGTIVTLEERRKRTEAIESLLVNGVGLARLERIGRETFGMNKAAVALYVKRIRERWAEESRAERPHNKAQQVRRIYGHIAEARRDKNWSAVAQFEKLLAQVLGTMEPVEINVNIDATVTEAALHVVANLTPERRTAMIEEQRALRALAAKQVITVQPENGTQHEVAGPPKTV